MKDIRFWRGLLLLLVLLLGGPLLIALFSGAWQFAAQPPRFDVALEGTQTAIAGQEIALRLHISNPTDGPLILWSATLDAPLQAALASPAFDPPPYQVETAADGAATYLFNTPLDPAGELQLFCAPAPSSPALCRAN